MTGKVYYQTHKKAPQAEPAALFTKLSLILPISGAIYGR